MVSFHWYTSCKRVIILVHDTDDGNGKQPIMLAQFSIRQKSHSVTFIILPWKHQVSKQGPEEKWCLQKYFDKHSDSIFPIDRSHSISSEVMARHHGGSVLPVHDGRPYKRNISKNIKSSNPTTLKQNKMITVVNFTVCRRTTWRKPGAFKKGQKQLELSRRGKRTGPTGWFWGVEEICRFQPRYICCFSRCFTDCFCPAG